MASLKRPLVESEHEKWLDSLTKSQLLDIVDLSDECKKDVSKGGRNKKNKKQLLRILNLNWSDDIKTKYEALHKYDKEKEEEKKKVQVSESDRVLKATWEKILANPTFQYQCHTHISSMAYGNAYIFEKKISEKSFKTTCGNTFVYLPKQREWKRRGDKNVNGIHFCIEFNVGEPKNWHAPSDNSD